MRQVTATEKYRAVLEGTLSKNEFVRQMRQSFPQFINQFNGFDDSVTIMKRNNLLFEVDTPVSNNVSDDSLRRALDIEITALGHDPVTCDDAEVQEKAKSKAIANLKKDSPFRFFLLA